MATHSFHLLIIVLLCIGIQRGLAQCSLSSISVQQSPTGAVVEGQPEFEVTVTNSCSCMQSQVTVKCFGLSSVSPVDPAAIQPVGPENCIVAGGGGMAPNSSIRFKYAWKTPQDFPVVSTNIEC